ncbi:MAG: hypothetical protein QOF62_865 [Pyrinomonadaceae bacterium]|jgi:hypothetical protein|nr:hypothetical protein [Pyrinomonadaceae bacterium]
MKLSTIAALLTRLFLAVVLSASPLAAQKRGIAPQKPAPTPLAKPAEPNPTFDTLLADDSYKIYFEVRGVGQLLHSPAVNDLLEPITKIVGPSKEFNAVLKWLDAHAESLAGSRLFVASWPTQTSLPAVLLAIEFASPEEAQKFEPQLRRFMPTLTPTPEPTPASRAGQPKLASTPEVQPQPSAASSFPYHIAHVGSLVLLSDKAFAFRDLKPRRAKLLAEDQNFVTARNRFASESLFLYVDVKAIEKEDQERRKKYEEDDRRIVEEERSRAKQEQTSPPETTEPTIVEATEMATPDEPPPPAPKDTATLSTSTQVQTPTATLSGQEKTPDSALLSTLSYSLYGALFGGQPRWPEAIAAAVAFEGDAYVLRALIVNSAENKDVAIPFLPQLVSGPALIPASPAVLPADADLFVSASLEYPQMYDGLLKAIAAMNERGRDYSMQAVSDAPAVSPFAEFEKKLGLKIKDDILPLLGNELAIALVPKRADDNSANPSATPAADTQQKVKTYDPDPIIAIAVKDKDAVRHLIPKLIEAMGFKGASLVAQTERKDDTETTTYADLLSYAFVGDFLILSLNPAAVKRAVASYLAGETLSSNSYFRNASRWQSRQVQAQAYMAPVMVQRYGLGGANSVNERTAELLSHVNLPIEPLTYSLSNEGSGPLHELHFPKNLLLLMMASISNEGSSTPLQANEAAVKSQLRTIVSAEATYQATTGDGRYGIIDELVKAGLLSKEPIERYGYEIELTVSANKFAATAVPLEYGKSGSLSYFVDESGVMRGSDRAGGPAMISDPPIQ